jgi:exopolyphosphatase / guanosine-5'-triphosphate,3'-diphosphate pyrophosphatase
LEILADETRITRLGKSVDADKKIAPEAAEKTLAALGEFGQKAKQLGASAIHAVGTSALRDAANGAEIVAEAEKRLGGMVEIIAGEREAALTYLAARESIGMEPVSILVTSDIGGGSTEVVIGLEEAVQYAESLQLGAVRLTERAGIGDPVTADAFQTAVMLADAALAEVPVPPAWLKPKLVASGGTSANLAAMEIAGRGEKPSFENLHGMILTKQQIEERLMYLASLPLSERRQVPGLEPDRADVIVAGALVQARLLSRLGLDQLTVSLRGLRYGLLYELLGVGDVAVPELRQESEQ